MLNINLSVEGGQLVRIADTSFGPGDDFCSVWHFFDLIPEGAGRTAAQIQNTRG